MYSNEYGVEIDLGLPFYFKQQIIQEIYWTKISRYIIQLDKNNWLTKSYKQIAMNKKEAWNNSKTK